MLKPEDKADIIAMDRLQDRAEERERKRSEALNRMKGRGRRR